jgi:hypothetical protein
LRRLFSFAFGLFLAFSASAQIYKHVDEHGNVTFSDIPSEDAQRVEVNPTNTTPPPPPDAFPAPPPEPEPGARQSYEVAITSPANETIIPRGPGNFTVTASVSPSLDSEHQLQLMMDGSPREEPQTSTAWDLTNVFRGEHNIQVAIIDAEGEQLSISEPVTVFVFRPSTNDANRGRTTRPPRPTPLNN